jgi:imidazolonepropionase
MTTSRIFVDRLLTTPPRATDVGAIERAFVDLDGERIERVGEEANAPPFDGPTTRARLVTAGLVDAHTHAPWAGSRHAEYALKMAGADYETIAKSGGGIVSTMRAVREQSHDDLTRELVDRVRRMTALGVTTVEAKSGYGLDLAGEEKQLRAIRAASRLVEATLVPTFLGLHALPPEAAGDRDGYAARVLRDTYPTLAADGLFRFVDAYVDRAAFSVEHARPLCERARADGFGVRLHVGQFADVGGAALAADIGASSIDHAEHVADSALEALAAAETRVVLLPVASLTLRGPAPDVAAMRRAGLRLVVASDANPGTAPTESLPLALALAVRLYGLTVDEALRGATVEAAASLGLFDRGHVSVGARADLVLWDLPHEAALVQPWGTSRASRVVIGGRVVQPG